MTRLSRTGHHTATSASTSPRFHNASRQSRCLSAVDSPSLLQRAMASMSRRISAGDKQQLWTPQMGIRFSPSPDSTPLYPRLDAPRFFQTAVAEAIARPGEPDREPVNPVKQEEVAGTISTIAPNEWATKKKATLKPVSSQVATSEPPSTSLPFVISHDKFYAARKASSGSRESFWSHTMYHRQQKADDLHDNVKVHYCTSRHTMEHVCKKYFLGEPVLGFDLEWLPYSNRQSGARENVSLIQIASPGRIGLFHLALFSDKDVDNFADVAPTFRQMMEDPNVSKVGVHVQGDFTRLRKFLGVESRGVFELSHLYKQVRYAAEKKVHLVNKVPVALATQVHECLGLPLFKGDSVRSSNWMRALNSQQVLYSASDAYAGLQLYHVLDAKRRALDPSPERPHHAELGLAIPMPKMEDSSECSLSESENIPAPQPPRDSRIINAEELAKSYRERKATHVSTAPSALRAYYIWHGNDNLKPQAIAEMLREPPLKTNTVVSYILDAIVQERMPYDKKRLKTDVLSLLNQRVAVGGRYGALLRSCEEA